MQWKHCFHNSDDLQKNVLISAVNVLISVDMKTHYGICAGSWVLVFAIYLCVFPNFEVLKSLIPDWDNIESPLKARLLIKTTLSSFKQTQGTWEYGELVDDVVAINGMVERGNNITLQFAKKINLNEMHFKSTPHWRVNKYRNTKRLA